MQTDWKTAKRFVVERLQADGESSIDFSDTVFEGAFDVRCQLALSLFTKATCWLYASKSALTLSLNDWDVSLDDPAKCEHPIFSVMNVWISGQRIMRYAGVQQLNNNYDPANTSNAPPQAWAQLNDYKIRFSSPCPAGLTNTFVEGFYSHPKPANDDATLLIPLEQLDLYGAFAAVSLRSKVWSEDITLERLKSYSMEAAEGIKAIYSRQMMRYFQGGAW